MANVIIHVDLNAFFATCEEIRNTSLSKLPLAIGGKGRSGIVSTANYVARSYGVHSGQPTFQALEACPSLCVIPPDFDYYRVMSQSFFAYLSRFSNKVEKASVDEAFVDASEFLKTKKDPMEALRFLQLGLLKETGLRCSIGVAPTKWLAKMASDMKKPLGLTLVRRRDIPEKIYPLPIESFWGIGSKTTPVLRCQGILSIGDLARALHNPSSPAWKVLGKFAQTALEWVEGKGDDVVCPESSEAQSIGASETLMKDADSFEEISQTLQSLCHEVAWKAGQEGKVGWTVSLSLKDTDFHSHQRSETFDSPISSEHDLYRIARQLFSNFMESQSEFRFRLIGVTLSKLEDRSKQNVQMSFWDYSAHEKENQTKLLIDEWNRKMKGDFLKRASQAGEKNGTR